MAFVVGPDDGTGIGCGWTSSASIRWRRLARPGGVSGLVVDALERSG